MNNNLQYISLHQHSHFSYLDSLNKPKDLIKKAKELGMPAIAISDHGHVHGFVKIYKECKKHGIKFIPGIEAYFTHKGEDKERKSRHLTILAMNNEGLCTLYKLATLASKPINDGGGFYYLPRIDWRMLEKYNKGIIILSGCMNSPINHEFGRNEDYNAGKEHAKHFIKIVGKDRFFVEMQLVNDPMGQKEREIYIPEQEKIYEYSRKLSKDLSLQTCATNDCHIINKDDYFAHEILKAISARTSLSAPVVGRDPEADDSKVRGRLVFNGFDYHMKSTEEMLEKFTKEDIECTQKISDMCNVDFKLHENHMPKFDNNIDDKEAFEILKKQCRKGWRELKLSKKQNMQEYVDRVKKELSDIKEAGLQNYFLIVWDVIQFCLDKGIPLGPGRGSAGGSLVSYLLRITDLDPIEYGLIWERFWNKGRKGSMPDIDLDICITRRDEVIEHIVNKFGKDKVFPMMTVSTMVTKQAIKDTGKALCFSYAYMNNLTKEINDDCKTVDEAIEKSKKIKLAAEKGIDEDVAKWEKELLSVKNISKKNDDDNIKTQIQYLEKRILERKKSLKTLFKVARKLEGVARQRSAHACALLISDESVFGKVPLCYDAKHKKMLTAFDMYDLEELGYLKLDILGLKTLDVCSDALDKTKFKSIRDIKDFKDENIYSLISTGKTKGIFQLEEHLGRKWCAKIKPKNLDELSDILALIRPAVLEVGMADEYLKNRQDPERIGYIHRDLKPILENTYGCMLYQEQMIEIVKHFAGFNLVEADKIRKIVGKKKIGEMEKHKEEFINGCKNNGHSDQLANELWRWIERGAEYGFNRSHSMAYAKLAYITAYLKYYRPIQFYCALLKYSYNKQKPLEEIKEVFFDANYFDIEILPPNIAISNKDFEIIDNKIYFGLSSIKGVGKKCVSKLSKIKEYDWQSILVNYDKIGIKKDVIESLIKCGALDHLGLTRLDMQTQYNFIRALRPKEKEIFTNIFNDSLEIKKETKNKTHKFKFKKARNFLHAVGQLCGFLVLHNREIKYINSPRATKAIDLCKDILYNYDNNKEYSIGWLGEFENLILGIPAKYSPIDQYYDNRKTHTIIECEKSPVNMPICSIGMISGVYRLNDKKGRAMAFFKIEDGKYMMSAIAFSDTYEKFRKLIKNNKIILIKGKRMDGGILTTFIEEIN